MHLDRLTLRSPWKTRTDTGSASDFFEQSGLGQWANRLKAAGLPADALLRSLKAETEPELLFQELFALGCELERRNAPGDALLLFSSLQTANTSRYPISTELKAKITERALALRGQGSGAAESLGRSFLKESIAPELILGMTGASLIGRAASAAFFSRLSLQPAISPLLAKALAGSGGLLLEAPALTLLNRGAAELLGKNKETGFSDSLQSSFLMLGAFKLSGAFSQTLAKPLARSMEALPGGNAMASIFRHGIAFGSILGGQEILRHFVPDSGASHRLRDAALFWLQAQVGQHLSAKLLGPRLLGDLAEVENRPRRPQHEWSFAERFLQPANASPSNVDWHAPLLMSSQPPKLAGMPWLGLTPPSISIDVKKTAPLSEPPAVLHPVNLESLRSLVREIDPSLAKVEALVRLAAEYRQIAKARQGRDILREAVSIASDLSLDPERFLAWGQIGLGYHAAGLPRHAATYFDRAFKDATQLHLEILRPELLDSFDALLRWLAEMQSARPMYYLDQAMQFGLDAQAVAFPNRGENELKHQVATRLAKMGNHTLALKLAQEIDTDLSLETQVRIARTMVEHGERSTVKSLFKVLDGAVDVDLLRSDLALDYLKTFQPDHFREHYARLHSEYHKIDTLLKAAELLRTQGKVFQSIEMVEEAKWRFRHGNNELSDDQRPLLRIKIANLTYQQGQTESSEYYLRSVRGDLPRFFRPSAPLSSENIPTLAEYLMTIHEIENRRTAYLYLPHLLEQDRQTVQRHVALRFGEKGKIDDAQVWAGDIEIGRRSAAQVDLAKTFFRSGLTDAAFELAQRIVDPAASFDALLWLHRASSREIPTPSTPPSVNPTPASSQGGSSPVKSFSSAGAITVNARSLGSDIQAVADRPLGEPPSELIDAVPWHLLAGKPAKDPEPNFLQLSLPDAAPIRLSSDAPLTWTASDSGSSGKPISDPPPSATGFNAESVLWVRSQNLGVAEVKLVENFLDTVYRYVWQILNYQSGTRLAHRLASGKPVTLRLIPKNQSLRDYSLEMIDAEDAPQEKYNMVQLRFDPETGMLSPMPFGEHDEYEKDAVKMGVDIRRHFIPFYRRIYMACDSLRASKLMQHLPDPLRRMLVDDPTMQRPQPAAPQPYARNPDSLIVNYRPYVFKRTTEEVEEFAKDEKLPEEGKRRLLKLTQHILAVLFDRESKINAPENIALKSGNSVFVVITPDSQVPGEMVIEVLSQKEMPKRQKTLSPNAVTLFLLRYGPMGGDDENYPHIQHHYRGVNKTPTVADLSFQRYLGLQNRLHMLWEVMDIRPTAETLKHWENWMVENAYFEETIVERLPPAMK